MILATEMTRHFEHLAKFVSVFGTDLESKDVGVSGTNLILLNSKCLGDDIIFVLT